MALVGVVLLVSAYVSSYVLTAWAVKRGFVGSTSLDVAVFRPLAAYGRSDYPGRLIIQAVGRWSWNGDPNLTFRDAYQKERFLDELWKTLKSDEWAERNQSWNDRDIEQ